MKIVACKLRKEHAEQFKQYAKDNGTTPNALLKSYVLKPSAKVTLILKKRSRNKTVPFLTIREYIMFNLTPKE